MTLHDLRHDPAALWASPPPLLMTSDPGSFARSTIVERKPQIIAQVLEDNGYPPDIQQRLADLQAEIAGRPMQPITEQADDAADWNKALEQYRGRTWLQVPWYFAEVFFYRKLLEAVRYLQPGPWQGHDPFGRRKQRQGIMAATELASGWAGLSDVPSSTMAVALLHSCLWGNRADLSNFTIREQARGGLAASSERGNILIDDTDQVIATLSKGLGRVDFVNDNVGMELLFDLALADFLLAQGWARQVVFHLKDRPFFVSDAMVADVEVGLRLLEGSADLAVRQLGARLRGHLTGERLLLRAEPFWTSHRMFREMPAMLRKDLAVADLVLLKGDVNYRRLLDDRHWPPSTSMAAITAYFPAPFAVLRTLKGEIMVGLAPGQAEALAREDPSWLINGKRGVIQLVSAAKGVRTSDPLVGEEGSG